MNISSLHGIFWYSLNLEHEIFRLKFFWCWIFSASMIILILAFNQHTKDSTAGVSVKYNLSAYVASFVPNNLYSLTAAVAFSQNYNGKHFYIWWNYKQAMTDREKRINYNRCIMNCLFKLSSNGMLDYFEKLCDNKKFLIKNFANFGDNIWSQKQHIFSKRN